MTELNDCYEEADEELGFISEYDISSNPNDFNVATLKSYIESDAIAIPSFQRNYVWDISRASRFIESLLLGLPIPQLFFYEERKNRYLVVDGQQRLMTIYYYLTGRFPKIDKRSYVRKLFDKNGAISYNDLCDDSIFQDFNLRLPSSEPNQKNPLDGLSYENLGEQQTTLDLRTIRCVMVRQNSPQGDDSSIYEIFNRLNTGGTNLKPQEIRSCMYRSPFYAMLSKINQDPRWRRFFKKSEPDLHLRDIEILLRSFAMLETGKNYSTSMPRFLNMYSKQQTSANAKQVEYLENLFYAFLEAASPLEDNVFMNERAYGKFNINLFEAVFVMTTIRALRSRTLNIDKLENDRINELKDDLDFIAASAAQTTNKSNVSKRLNRAADLFNVEW